MKYGLFYDNIRQAIEGTGVTVAEFLARAAEKGLGYLEINLETLRDGDVDLALLKQLSLGISVCIHCTADGLLNSDRARPVLEDIPWLAGLGNVFHLMLIPWPGAEGEDQLARCFRFFRAFAEKAAQYGLPVSVEDFDGSQVLCGSCRDMIAFGQAVPRLQYTFDSGNFQFHGEQPLDCFPALAERLCHVHVKDRASLDPQAPAVVTGTGVLPLKACFALLRQLGFDGGLTAEMYGVDLTPEGLLAGLEFVVAETA